MGKAHAKQVGQTGRAAHMAQDAQVAQAAQVTYDPCTVCPRVCRARRDHGERGVCGADGRLMVSRAALHHWEEPPISGTQGSGTVFFNGCSLRCCFCQNYQISQTMNGLTITVERLVEIFFELQKQGAHNINLVTPTHYALQIAEALKRAQDQGLAIPVIYNTSGYERTETLELFRDLVSVWLPDAKYISPERAHRYSRTRDYPKRMLKALAWMLDATEQKGGARYSEDGLIKQGVIVRHLVLPGQTEESCKLLKALWERFENRIDLSLMNQYTPLEQVKECAPELFAKVSDAEYDQVLSYAHDRGFRYVYWQEGGTVSESFIPPFDHTGVRASALHALPSTLYTEEV